MSNPDSFLPSGGALRGGLWRELSSDMDRRAALPAGARIGPYAVEKEIGRGGMGAVYLARRADGQFEQQVAVKVLKPGMESEEVARRFGRERQILASLQHPSIARLYDGGITDDGRPYFVMEHVDGVAIDVHCRERGLSVQERLALFVKVGDAVQHAHGSLVVHRDLKPGNILVTAGGDVKLLDFGIAKLLEADAADDTAPVTQTTMRVMTPEYASPEQVRAEPVTTASDIYQLGLLLYEMLTGERAYRLRDRTQIELERAICEAAPVPPSQAVPAGRLRKRLAGDLDNIVLMALRKEPERRYATAAQMVEDVARHLANRPVRARPDTLRYRTATFVLRHRRGVAAAVGVALALAGLVAFYTTRLAAERDLARREADKAAKISELLAGLFTAADPFRPGEGEPTVRDVLDAGATRVDKELAGDPEVQTDLRMVLGHVYWKLAAYDKAAPLLERALDQRRSLHGPRHPAVAHALDELGYVRLKQNHFDRAEPLLREALAQRRELLGNAHADTALSAEHLATLFQEKNDFRAAESLFRETLDIRRKVHGPDHEEVANSLVNLGVVLLLQGAYDDVEPLYRQALAIHTRRSGEAHLATAQNLQNLAQVQHYRGQIDEAESLHRRALAAKRKVLGDAHPSVTISLNNLGRLLAQEKGQLGEAESLFREALALDRKIFGERHVYVAESLSNLGMVERLQGDFDEALKIHHQALAMTRALFGQENVKIAQNLNHVATTLILQGDLDGAIPLLREARAQLRRLVGEQHRTYGLVSVTLAKALRESGQAAEAESLFRTEAARLDPEHRGQLPLFIATQVGLGQSLVDQGRATEATPLLERALAMSRGRFGDADWRTGEATLALGLSLAASAERARAESVLREARAILIVHRRAQPRLLLQLDAALKGITGSAGR